MKNSTGWPTEADGVDRPVAADHTGSANVGNWDKASTLRSSAKQRKATFAACLSKSDRCRSGTSALPPEAESRRSSALGQSRPSAFERQRRLHVRSTASRPTKVLTAKQVRRPALRFLAGRKSGSHFALPDQRLPCRDCRPPPSQSPSCVPDQPHN
jgi:hypothetical protein